jgi:elongation factor Ts
MSEISASLVKQLRDETGAGMMECKKALTEAAGNLEEARVILRKRGLASAAKKTGRSAKQGLILARIENDGKSALLLEVNCETDFVARTPNFEALVNEIADHIAASKPASVEALMATSIGAVKVSEFLSDKIATIGENLVIPRFEMATASANGHFGSYIHPGSQLGVVVEIETNKPESAKTAGFAEVVRDLAMQIAAANPQFLDRTQVTPEAIEKEKDVQRGRALAEGKPEKMVDKIIEGRMGKFYEEICLLEQPFIKDNAFTVTAMLDAKGKEMGDTLKVTRMFRYKVGETAAPEAESAE